MHRTALKGKKTHELLCYLSDANFIFLLILLLPLQYLLQNLLKCCKGGVSRTDCSCLIYFHSKNQFGGLISHHLHWNPWRLAGCHLQAFVSAIALPWFIKMSLASSHTIDLHDTQSIPHYLYTVWKILIFVSDLSSTLKSLIYSLESVCCVPKCHGPSFFPEILPCPSLYQSPLVPWSWASEGRERPRGHEDVPPSRLVTPCVEGVSAQILPSSTLAFSTICCKVKGAALGILMRTPSPASLPGGGLVSKYM